MTENEDKEAGKPEPLLPAEKQQQRAGVVRGEITTTDKLTINPRKPPASKAR
jgi:hypothetical protein